MLVHHPDYPTLWLLSLLSKDPIIAQSLSVQPGNLSPDPGPTLFPTVDVDKVAINANKSFVKNCLGYLMYLNFFHYDYNAKRN